MKPFASVIVLNYNGKDLLEECLESLSRQTYPNYEIILVDNGSTDDSGEYARSHFPHVQVVQLKKNRGFAGGNNFGLHHAKGDYIALLNNDTRVEPQWLESLCDALDRHEDAGTAASKMLIYDNPKLIDAAGDMFFGWGTVRRRGHLMLDENAYDKEISVFGACAGAALYRREMIEKIGFLDEDFLIYFDDVDLSFRAQLAGWKCIYVPEARVLHKVSATMEKTKSFSVYISKRNSMWVVLKNMPTPLLWKYGFLIFAYNFISDIKWTIRGYLKEVVRARMHSLLALRVMAGKRRSIQKMRNVSLKKVEGVLSLGLPFKVGL